MDEVVGLVAFVVGARVGVIKVIEFSEHDAYDEVSRQIDLKNFNRWHVGQLSAPETATQFLNPRCHLLWVHCTALHQRSVLRGDEGREWTRRHDGDAFGPVSTALTSWRSSSRRREHQGRRKMTQEALAPGSSVSYV